MHQDDPGLEQRLSRFEAQLDRFSLALHQWQHSQSQTPADPSADLDQRMRALEETENALVNYREEQERLVKLTEQARESTRAATIARVRYREGVVDFLALLDAERTQLQAEDAVAQAEAGVFTSVIALYKALGGIPM